MMVTDMKQKRMHPLKMLDALIGLIKDAFIPALFLFVIANPNGRFIPYLKLIFIAYLVIRLIGIVIGWLVTTYEIKDDAIYISRGVFKKKNRTVPIEQVQNIQTKTPVYFKPFHVTSLTLVTSVSGDEAALKIEAVKWEEKERIEDRILAFRQHERDGQSEHTQEAETFETAVPKRMIHFRPTRKDLIKASFLSLSFLALIPILAAVFEKAEDIFDLEGTLNNIYQFITSSWYTVALTIIIFILISIGFGLVRTFLKYGKFEIASDAERIYIKRGTLNERTLSIRKDHVQAIELIQNPIKKWLRLTEVKLVSATSDEGEEAAEINSLYPFLPTKRAYSLMEELLPAFKLSHQMHRLPKRALYMKFLRVPWIWLILSGVLFWWKPSLWYLSIVLFILTYMMRYFRYKNARFLIHDEFVQFKMGGLWSSLYITNRKKVIEVEVTQSYLQRKLNLTTIGIVNRTNPINYEEMEDIPISSAKHFLTWYHKRSDDIQLEQNES
ncbi:MAG TPA: PH domain-containing protein [Cerasibacillus sp.]|uniref:PH domain-containing protein n=1 Tax=Cerasibacillus sp. TaxID=2498711 RepID=UPI002F40B29E